MNEIGADLRARRRDLTRTWPRWTTSPSAAGSGWPNCPSHERDRRNRHQELVQDLRDRLRKTALGGPESSRQKHVGRGKLLPRERVDTLLDPGSPFLELSPLAANGMYGDEAPGAG